MKRRQKTAFGEYLVSEIKKAEISQEEFYTAVGIKKPYFYDLLTAAPPPIALQDKMLAVLDVKTGMNDNRRRKLYDLAAMGRGEIPADIVVLINSYTKTSTDGMDDIRNTLKAMTVARG